MVDFNVTFEETSQQFVADFGVIHSILPDPYDGSYEATPSTVDQVFNTKNKSMSNDFVVHKIPNNYGLITYNGYEITVS